MLFNSEIEINLIVIVDFLKKVERHYKRYHYLCMQLLAVCVVKLMGTGNFISCSFFVNKKATTRIIYPLSSHYLFSLSGKSASCPFEFYNQTYLPLDSQGIH